MNTWINGRPGTMLDCTDRGLHYGDGLFETMRVRRGVVRLLDHHLDRLCDGCRRLGITAPPRPRLRAELARIAARRADGVLKLIVTRGAGRRGYRPTGRERCTRLIALYPPPRHAAPALPDAARVRLCKVRLGVNETLGGLKTLNRLESVLARAEWTDPRIWEGLMCDTDDHIVCGTMSNVFLRRGASLVTPSLDRCGVAGVMRRWVIDQAPGIGLRVSERRLRWEDLGRADEVFMTNAVAGIVPVARIDHGRTRLAPREHTACADLDRLLEAQ
jgi:4-amino-4-deoxychorismate lyase